MSCTKQHFNRICRKAYLSHRQPVILGASLRFMAQLQAEQQKG